MYIDKKFYKTENQIESITPRFIRENKIIDKLLDRVKAGWANYRIIGALENIIQCMNHHIPVHPDESYSIQNVYNMEGLMNYSFSESYFAVPIIKGLLIALKHNAFDVTCSINIICLEINRKYGKNGITKYGIANIKPLVNIYEKQTESKEIEESHNEHTEKKNINIWSCSLCITVNKNILTKCKICGVPRNVKINMYDVDGSQLVEKAYYSAPPLQLENEEMIAKYFATLGDLNMNVLAIHTIDFSDEEVLKCLAEWMWIDWNMVKEFKETAFIPDGFDIDLVLKEVFANEWEECYFKWVKWHYYRNNKKKMLEIFGHLVFQQMSR
eukprot:549779_1